MKFYESAGKMALGSRIRYLAEMVTSEASRIYAAYGTELHPKWFPVFYVLSKASNSTVTSIADAIGHTHVSVSKTLKEMSRAGLLNETPDKKDRRKTLISLSKRGREIAKKIESQYQDVNAAVEDLSREATQDLWATLDEWEALLKEKTLYQRVMDKKKAREGQDIEVVTFRPKYKSAFKKLNEDWITTYFKLEKPDIEALGNPKKYILDKGGVILVALLNDEPVGVCALIPIGKGTLELAKMAVRADLRGKNIGYVLGKAAIQKARELKAKRIFLESNTILVPAMRLYRKLGFKKIIGPPTPYERCNIQMELTLT